MSRFTAFDQLEEDTEFPTTNETHTRRGQKINQIGKQHAQFQVLNQHHDNEMVNPNFQISSSTKRRKLKSKVWNDFALDEKDGKEWAICNHCRKKFVGSGKSGTTHLKNHLETCRGKNKLVEGAGTSTKTSDSTTSVVVKEKSVIDKELNPLDVARVIIKYGFSSLNAIKIDILHVYKEEKEKLIRYIDKLPCRFNLKIEWFHKGYFFIVLQFIDDSWELKKKIIDFQRAKGFVEILKCSLLEWNIDKKICSTVADVGGESDAVISEIDNWLSKRGSLPFIGQFFPIDCLVYSLQHYIRNGGKWICDVLKKMKHCFDFARKTSSNERMFQTPTEEFKLLECALELKNTFCELERKDPDFKLINLSTEEWDKASVVCEYWKLLKDATG
ncbi:zinc finger BED domain-containing protein RICESLEEPER 3-like isoform X2 [Pistacia vera]|nr:zinc finger BED domain-containing protein RICESLEEPER 3-like isoform X2 [Pistacia vera]